MLVAGGRWRRDVMRRPVSMQNFQRFMPRSASHIANFILG
jgi:hypothetical protein